MNKNVSEIQKPATGRKGSHTPGPWEAKAVFWGRNTGESEDAPRRIAEWRVEGGKYPDSLHASGIHSETNARLIAAAPELLEACKLLRSIIHDQVACVDSKYDNGLNKASAAIAKAEGK